MIYDNSKKQAQNNFFCVKVDAFFFKCRQVAMNIYMIEYIYMDIYLNMYVWI